MMLLSLAPHPDTPCPAIREIAVEAARSGASLSLSFVVSGDISQVVLPEHKRRGRADELWKHTCLEAFVRPATPIRSPRRKSGPSVHDLSEGSADQSLTVQVERPLGPDFRRGDRVEGKGYAEINLSPSGQWAAYGFDGYRTGMAERAGFELISLAEERSDSRYQLTAALELTNLPGDSDWSVGLSAVIELKDGTKSYWALHHAPGQPDFHHPDAFAASLPPESP